MRFKEGLRYTAVLFLLLLTIGVARMQAEESKASKSPDYPGAPEDVHPRMVGTKAPTASLKSSDGNPFDLVRAISEKPAVLVFYRGYWCPHCNRQLKQLQDLSGKLSEMGYQILAISPDPPEKLVGTIEKHGLTFPLLSDGDLSLSAAFGIVFQTKGRRALPVPAVYIVGADGLITFNFVHPKYTVRLDPNVLLAAARSGIRK